MRVSRALASATIAVLICSVIGVTSAAGAQPRSSTLRS
jgi:hypothetical protein